MATPNPNSDTLMQFVLKQYQNAMAPTTVKGTVLNSLTSMFMYGPAMGLSFTAQKLLGSKISPLGAILTVTVAQTLISSGMQAARAKKLAIPVTAPRSTKKDGGLSMGPGEFPFPKYVYTLLRDVYDPYLNFSGHLEDALSKYPPQVVHQFMIVYVPMKYAHIDRKLRQQVKAVLARVPDSDMIQRRVSVMDILLSVKNSSGTNTNKSNTTLLRMATNTSVFPDSPSGDRRWIQWYLDSYKIDPKLRKKQEEATKGFWAKLVSRKKKQN